MSSKCINFLRVFAAVAAPAMRSTMRSTKILLAVSLGLLLTSCGPSGNKPNVEIIQDMLESPALKPQEKDPRRPGHTAMRVPPKGPVPMGAYRPYKYGDDFVASAKNKNPFAGKMDPEILAKGKWQYETYCSVCHGMTGAGDGSVAAKLGGVPGLTTDHLKSQWKDGQLFHVITRGRGRMGQYAGQIPNTNERWALVNYIRSLQQGN